MGALVKPYLTSEPFYDCPQSIRHAVLTRPVLPSWVGTCTDGIGSDAEGHTFERCQGPPGGTSQVRMGVGSLSRVSCSSLNSHFFLHPPLKHFGVNCLWCDFTHFIFYLFIFFKIYFIFGCVGSLLLCAGFL